MPERCGWCGDDPLYHEYHDQEWGQPCQDDRTLFEFLILESAQAGLNWLTILKKREGYRRAFAGFDPRRVAAFGKRDQQRLLADSGIVRNRLKIESAIGNARAFLELQAKHGRFAHFLWDFVDGRPQQNHWRQLKQVPAQTPAAEKLSKTLKKEGFRFVGPTICYAYMQAMGLVNDHLISCPWHEESAKAAQSFKLT